MTEHLVLQNNLLLYNQQTIIMIKRLITSKINNYLFLINKNRIVNAKPPLQSEHSVKQPYEILLKNNIQNMIKFPSSNILRMLRARGITRIMAANHNLKSDTDRILQAHIECLYSLIHRIQPSIEAISMFAEKIFQQSDNIRQMQIDSPSLINLLKPTIVSKIVKVAEAIDAFYNQTFRSLISVLIIKLLEKSVLNESEFNVQMKKLLQQFDLVKKGEKSFYDQEGNAIENELIESQFAKRKKQLCENYRFLNDLDYWTGFSFVISMDYYTEKFLSSNVGLLEKALEKDMRGIQINQIMVKIKCIISLQKFKNHKQVGQKILKTLHFSYNRLVEQYFKILSNESSIIEIINSNDPIIQASLLTNFLTYEHYQKAKKVYMKIFKTVFNVYNNGILLIDIKRMRGLFQLILILYSHQDTKEIHQILTQFQKIMIMYPLQRFSRLEAQFFVAQKYGFKSDYFADAFLKELIQQKQKLERNKGHLHNIHQITRQILLAKKFLIFKKIALKPSKEQLQMASSLAHSLYDPNVWYCLTELSEVTQLFLTSASFSHQIYFQKSGIFNLFSGFNQRKKIEELCRLIGVKNISKQYMQILQQMKSSNSRYNLRLTHLSNWQHNPHARMKTLLQLASHNFHYLRKISSQEANNFLQQFLTKTIGTSLFYTALKQKFAYPQILSSLIELMSLVDSKNFSIQSRDIQAIKRLYQTQLLKLAKSSQKPSFLNYYQQHLDLLQFNRVVIPFDREVYGLSNIGNCILSSLLYQGVKRFQKRKEYLKMQIETYIKFNKGGDISIQNNYIQFPYLADIKVKIKNDTTVVLFQAYEGEPNHFLNYKQSDMLKQSQIYWVNKGYSVYNVKCEKDVEHFIKKITKADEKIQQ